jgi:hypothetical protein
MGICLLAELGVHYGSQFFEPFATFVDITSCYVIVSVSHIPDLA